MIKNLEIKTYTCCGIEVTVKMDYTRGLISLVENNSCGGYPRKAYIFAEEPVERGEKWIEILGAMKCAIESATKEMNDYLEEKRKEAENTMCEMLDMANAMVKEKIRVQEPKKKGFFSKKK